MGRRKKSNKVFHVACHTLNDIENGYHWILENTGVLEWELTSTVTKKVKKYGKDKVKILLEIPFIVEEKVKILLDNGGNE
jgi:hypothetical protein